MAAHRKLDQSRVYLCAAKLSLNKWFGLHNPDHCHTASTPIGFLEIVSDDFRLPLHGRDFAFLACHLSVFSGKLPLWRQK
jgi:hypothetical protein